MKMGGISYNYVVSFVVVFAILLSVLTFISFVSFLLLLWIPSELNTCESDCLPLSISDLAFHTHRVIMYCCRVFPFFENRARSCQAYLHSPSKLSILRERTSNSEDSFFFVYIHSTTITPVSQSSKLNLIPPLLIFEDAPHPKPDSYLISIIQEQIHHPLD
jgi:hypothetical protein